MQNCESFGYWSLVRLGQARRIWGALQTRIKCARPGKLTRPQARQEEEDGEPCRLAGSHRPPCQDLQEASSDGPTFLPMIFADLKSSDGLNFLPMIFADLKSSDGPNFLAMIFADLK